MFKILAATVLGLAALAVLASDAQAAGGRRRCPPTYYVAPAPAAAAQADVSGPGYRAYSYEPAPTTMYRQFSRPAGGRSPVRAYENATNKSLGRGY